MRQETDSSAIHISDIPPFCLRVGYLYLTCMMAVKGARICSQRIPIRHLWIAVF